MKKRLSIISTLIEALQVGSRHLGLIIGFVIFIDAVTTGLAFLIDAEVGKPPTHSVIAPANPKAPADSERLEQDLKEMQQDISRSQHYLFISSIFSFLKIVVEIMIEAVVTASILGVLTISPSAAGVWDAIKGSTRRFAWRLAILMILLCLIAVVVVTIPLTLIIAIITVAAPHGSATHPEGNYFVEFTVALMAILYLIFVKYALANPLVVVEDMNPLPALRRSWQMTRGHFGYVLGCYVIVGTAEYFISYFFDLSGATNSFTWAEATNHLFVSIMNCYWILLAWCMFWRIRDAENAAAAPTLSPPEWPSGPRSA